MKEFRKYIINQQGKDYYTKWCKNLKNDELIIYENNHYKDYEKVR